MLHERLMLQLRTYELKVHDGCSFFLLLKAGGGLHQLKEISIPRLELTAAVIGSQLSHVVRKTLGIKQRDVYLWSDSRNVICWLRSDTKEHRQYVANRVQKIQDQTSKATWRWVNTEDNPADLGSRGLQLNQLLEAKIWWQGPDFLKATEDIGRKNLDSWNCQRKHKWRRRKLNRQPKYYNFRPLAKAPFRWYGTWRKTYKVVGRLLRLKRALRRNAALRQGQPKTDEGHGDQVSCTKNLKPYAGQIDGLTEEETQEAKKCDQIRSRGRIP